MIRIPTALALGTLMIAFGALAQDNEFGRTFGGEIQAITKQPRTLSGSLGLSRANGSGTGYEATLGGALLKDRIWFFASALNVPAMNLGSNFNVVDAKLTAQPVDWTTVSASYSDRQNTTLPGLPSSFLSLRSTSMLSDNMVLNISVSRQTARPEW